MKDHKTKNILDLFTADYQRYAVTVNINRVMPDIRDGLKPVQRYILYSMLTESTGYNRLVKCASIVGETMKLYHPHGDSSIYESLVKIANWYSSKIPLVTKHGNFGNMQGATPAAMRYTEARLSEFTKECVLGGIREYPTICDYRSNYDNKTVQPDYLPASVPLLLILGTSGIGLGKKTYIPSHNLTEVIDATISRIMDPTKPVILVPDECMGSDIIDTDWEKICNTGHGSFKVRAKIDIDTSGKHPRLIITSLPDSVKFSSIEEKIIELAKSSLPQIVDILNNSKGDNLNISIELAKGSDPHYVREMLYRKTSLEVTNTVNFEVVHNITPLRMNYTSYIDFFIDFTKNRKYRLYMCKYSKIETKIHELDFYIKVIESGKVDELVSKIRKENKANDDEFIEWMIKEFDITDVQAKYIYNIQIKKLSVAYLNKYKEEIVKYQEEANHYVKLLTDDAVLNQDVIDELVYIKNKYGEPRKSRLVQVNNSSNIPAGTFTIIITENNFVKKIQQGQPIGKADNPKYAMVMDNRDNLLLFSSKGKVYKLPIYKIPLMDKNYSGVDIRIMIKGLTSDIISIIPESVIKENAKADPALRSNLIVLTKENHIKRIDINDLCSVPPSGIIYAKLSVGETVKTVRLVNPSEDVIVFSDRKALRYPMLSVPLYGRMANGVIAMGGKVDYMDGFGVIHGNNSQYILVVTRSGKVNKFPVETLENSDRTKAGTSVMKLGTTDAILSIHGVNDGNKLVLVTSNGNVEIPVSEIPITSSISAGTRVVKGSPIIIKSRVELM